MLLVGWVGVISDGPGSFEDVARRVGVMDNIKARVPRGAYQGVVTCWHGNTKVREGDEKKAVVIVAAVPAWLTSVVCCVGAVAGVSGAVPAHVLREMRRGRSAAASSTTV